MSGPKIKRLYYSMNEVCEIAEVGTHTLRQWEIKYPIHPSKSQSGRKLYKPSDLELVTKIKSLIKQGYSESIIGQILDPQNLTFPEDKFIAREGKQTILQEIKQELSEILDLLK